MHPLEISNPLAFYQFDPQHPLWGLMIPASENGRGAVIALQIPIHLVDHVGETITESAQAAAAALAVKVHEYFEMWDTHHHGLPFHWALRLDALGTGSTSQVAPGTLPVFSNHQCDIVGDRLPRQKYFNWGGYVLSAQGTAIELFYPDIPEFFMRFPDDHFTTPTNVRAAAITVGGETRTITGFDHQNQIFTVDSAFSGTITNQWAEIFRSDVDQNGYWTGTLYPCYFFKEGAEDMREWMQAFCDAMEAAMAHEDWDQEIGPPVAVTVSDEDLNLGGIDYGNYYEAYYNLDGSGRASDEDYRIDENHTLAQWHAAFARDKSGEPLAWEPLPTGGFSPLVNDYRSYLIATISTAYNYHREMSTWVPLRNLWPRAHLSQYQLGNNYGVTIEVGEEYVPVPYGPGDEVYHGSRHWKGCITWDAYNCLTSPAPSAWLGPDGGIVPMGYTSARAFEGTVAAWSSGSPYELVVNSEGIDSTVNQMISQAIIGFWLNEDFEVFVQLPMNSVHPNHMFKVAVSGWNQSTLTFTLDPLGSPLSAVSANDKFVVYYPSNPYLSTSIVTGQLSGLCSSPIAIATASRSPRPDSSQLPRSGPRNGPAPTPAPIRRTPTPCIILRACSTPSTRTTKIYKHRRTSCTTAWMIASPSS